MGDRARANSAMPWDDGTCRESQPPLFFTLMPFPLRRKTLYGAPRFALGEMNS